MGFVGRLTALAIGVLVLGAACASSDRIRLVQDVPAEVAQIVDETSRDLESSLPWAGGCMLPVEVHLSRNVPDGAARYRAAEQLIEIEIPTSPARFRESLVHELGHHIDATCEDLDDLRTAFATSQGFTDSQTWDTGQAWELTPAEHFAEAVVAIVNGGRLLHADIVMLHPESIAAVESGPAP